MVEHAEREDRPMSAGRQASDPEAAQDQPHRHERPADWGWHAEFGRWARIAGWISVGVLLLFNVTTYYNTAQSPWLYGIAAAIVLILIRDRFRRKNAWRE
jgi:hypothetical protein